MANEYLVTGRRSDDGDYEIVAPIDTVFGSTHYGRFGPALLRAGLGRAFLDDGEYDFSANGDKVEVTFYITEPSPADISEEIKRAQERFSAFVGEAIRIREFMKFWQDHDNKSGGG